MRRVLLVLALIPAAAFAQPREYYGAIAYSPRSSAHGWSNNHPSRPDAEKTALANCRKFAKDCRALVSFAGLWRSARKGTAGLRATQRVQRE
jgi:hypothetical protein